MVTLKFMKSGFFFLFVLLLSDAGLSDLVAKEVPGGDFLVLETANKKTFKVYVSGPEDAGRGILLVHGWLGLDKDIEALTNQWAAAGYRAMAIDLYNGQIASNPKEAKKLMNSVNQTEANAKYASALNALKTPGRKLATIGWSFGGSQALRATLSAPELVSATVSYYPYGKMVSDKEKLAPMKSPILIQIGDKDFALPLEIIEQYKTDIKNSGKILEVNIYNAKHSFIKRKNKNYSKEATEEAAKSTFQFLDRYL